MRRVGTETVDGARIVHYRGTVTVRGLFAARDAAADKATRERRIESLDQFMALGMEDALIMDLWVDEDDRAKQFRMRGETCKLPDSADADPLDLTVTFLDINQPVSVEAPSAADTTDLGALADDVQDGKMDS
ncbi:hypothetical protein [Streptomyces bluensis]|uniref:Uncharacterized protein n=1 Tax=Streptomyces bluensis TaxID=33897 RepID=A0ABW6URZ6_9ACTN